MIGKDEFELYKTALFDLKYLNYYIVSIRSIKISVSITIRSNE